MKKKKVIKYKWALAIKGDPCILFRYETKEQAEKNIGQNKNLEVREIIG